MSETLYPHETVIGRITIWFFIGVALAVSLHWITIFLIAGDL
jgi:hypothetical protein